MHLAVDNQTKKKFYERDHKTAQDHLAKQRGWITKKIFDQSDQQKAGTSGEQHRKVGIATGNDLDAAI